MQIKLFDKFPGIIFLTYLEFISKTSKLVINNTELLKENTMVGYWHGDSYCMQLVLKHISKKYKKINIIVTSDKRGDAIEQIINHYGAKAIRLPDGLKMRPFFQELKVESKENASILAAALDGPIGPLHDPNKLLFLLAFEADKEMVYLRFNYSRVIRIHHRWDHYVIPLPFSKMTVQIEELGKINREDLQNFSEYKKKIQF